MTVEELIKILEEYPTDADVKIFRGSTNEIVDDVFPDIEDDCPVIY